MPHLEHFVLACGLLLRDISTAYFTLDDPDDTEPLYIPEYIAQTQCDLSYGTHIESVIKTAYEALRAQQEAARSAADARFSGTGNDLIDPQLRTEGPVSFGVDQTSLPTGGLQLTDEAQTSASKAVGTHAILQPLGSPPESSKQQSQADGPPKKRKKPVPSKPRPDALSRTFDPPLELTNEPAPASPNGSKRRHTPEGDKNANTGLGIAPAPRKRRRKAADEAGPGSPADVDQGTGNRSKRKRSPDRISNEGLSGERVHEEEVRKRRKTTKVNPEVSVQQPVEKSGPSATQTLVHLTEDTALRKSGRLRGKDRVTYTKLVRRE